jgi:hypothetical protein
VTYFIYNILAQTHQLYIESKNSLFPHNKDQRMQSRKLIIKYTCKLQVWYKYVMLKELRQTHAKPIPQKTSPDPLQFSYAPFLPVSILDAATWQVMLSMAEIKQTRKIKTMFPLLPCTVNDITVPLRPYCSILIATRLRHPSLFVPAPLAIVTTLCQSEHRSPSSPSLPPYLCQTIVIFCWTCQIAITD